MSFFGGGQKSFLETNAWQHSNLNSLRYNTSQAGSVIPIIYGTTRQQINLIALGDFRGPSGKKGKNGPLPLAGQHAGKGGGGGGKKGAGGKKSAEFSVDVDFAICQGPVDIGNTNKVWASAGVAFFQSVGLNLYTGADGQAADPVFEALGNVAGYSGTCHVTGTPMDLGSSPVLPNLSFEVTGILTGTAGSGFPGDANPANVVEDFLTNPRYGAGFPSVNLDPDIASLGANNYSDYCTAALFAISPALQGQTEAATWVSELARLTNTAIVWSGSLLKFIPYGDIELSGQGVTWTPNLIPLYSLTDNDFLPWNPHIDAHDPQLGEDDPVIITRANPADATNWMSIEYLDRENSYNKTVIPQFDQAAIDQYGIRTEPAIQGSCFCDKLPAEISLRLLLQRALYVRNTYRFQVGWQYALLEPMDIVLLTDARCGLFEQPVRITGIEENENGDLVVDAEEIKVDTSLPLPPVVSLGTVYFNVNWLAQTPIADPTPSPLGMVSVWIFPDQDVGELPIISTWPDTNLGISLNTTTGVIGARFSDGAGNFWEGVSVGGIVSADGDWHHFICSWDTTNVPASPITVLYDGDEVAITETDSGGVSFDLSYSDDFLLFLAVGGLIGFRGFVGGLEDYWFVKGQALDITDAGVLANFRTVSNRAVNLGVNGELPTGSPPSFFFHSVQDTYFHALSEFGTNMGTGGTGAGILGPALGHLLTDLPY